MEGGGLFSNRRYRIDLKTFNACNARISLSLKPSSSCGFNSDITLDVGLDLKEWEDASGLEKEKEFEKREGGEGIVKCEIASLKRKGKSSLSAV